MRVFSKVVAAGLAIAALFASGFAPGAGARAQDEVTRAVTNIAGDLYRFQNNRHYAVFLVTDAGIVVTDPINADAANWLRGELKRRFDKPVVYMIYSHDHADHISGGEVFADTATVVAHHNAAANIAANSVPTAAPDITFSDSLTLRVGGKTIELSYLGPNHGNALIVMNFIDSRALFAVDVVAVNRVPYRDFPGADIGGWIASLKALERMDFDILAPGHGPVGSRADVVTHRRYIEELYAEVLKRVAAGASLEETKAEVTMDVYRDWLQYQNWQQLNVEGMYRMTAPR